MASANADRLAGTMVYKICPPPEGFSGEKGLDQEQFTGASCNYLLASHDFAGRQSCKWQLHDLRGKLQTIVKCHVCLPSAQTAIMSP